MKVDSVDQGNAESVIVLTEDERKVIAAIRRLESVWKRHGRGLVLFNGNELRRGHSAESVIETFPGITGDGGDGGDIF